MKVRFLPPRPDRLIHYDEWRAERFFPNFMIKPITTQGRLNPFVQSLLSVWDHPTRVFLDHEALADMARTLARATLVVPCWRDPVFPEADDTMFVNFIGVGNAINFGFTDFETHESFRVEYKGKEWRGAFAMWACLRRALEFGVNILDASFLRHLDPEQCEQIFAGATGIPMLAQRLEILREIGGVLATRYQGSFHNVFKEARYRAFGNGGVVNRLIADFPSFRDESVHVPSGALLRFHKRAQLFAMMYEGRALTSKKLERISDAELVGPIADYDLPKTLHAMGVLRYSLEVEQKIRTCSLIERDSLEEQEIRAQTIHAQVDLVRRINEFRTDGVSILALDYHLWTLGRALREPHHFTRTTAY